MLGRTSICLRVWAHVLLEATKGTILETPLDMEASSNLQAQDFNKLGPCIYMHTIP